MERYFVLHCPAGHKQFQPVFRSRAGPCVDSGKQTGAVQAYCEVKLTNGLCPDGPIRRVNVLLCAKFYPLSSNKKCIVQLRNTGLMLSPRKCGYCQLWQINIFLIFFWKKYCAWNWFDVL